MVNDNLVLNDVVNSDLFEINLVENNFFEIISW